ncbi:MAG: hypothetical protein WBF79_18185 [Rhodococcus sp. (in: high G+C Gram-positive bacteria)]
MTPKVRLPHLRARSSDARETTRPRARVGALSSTPIAMMLAIVLPTLAAGVFWVSQAESSGSGVSGSGGTVGVAATAAGSATDPLSPARSALTNTALPLQILSGGMAELTDGSTELDDGAHQMSDGLRQARSGSAELADGMSQLRAGLWQLGDGSSQVSGGVDQVVGALTGVGAAQGQVELIVQQTLDSLTASTDPAAVASADQLRTVLDLLRTQGVNGSVLDDLQKLQNGARAVAYQLDDPSSEFVDGMVRATNGSVQLRDGLVLLDDGGVRLVDGTTRLVGGVGPMESMFSTLRSNVEKASSSLPPADRVETDPAGNASTFVVRSASAEWPYFAAVFVLVAAALVGFFVPRARSAIIGAVATSAAAVLALGFADTGASVAGSMTATVLIALWVAAITAATRAVRLTLGRTVGAVVLVVVGALQIVLSGLVLRGVGGAVEAISTFTPLGQVERSLMAPSAAGALVSVIAALATAAVSVAILSAHAPEDIDDAILDERIDAETVSSSVP